LIVQSHLDFYSELPYRTMQCRTKVTKFLEGEEHFVLKNLHLQNFVRLKYMNDYVMIIIMTFFNSSFEHKIINIIRLFAIIIHLDELPRNLMKPFYLKQSVNTLVHIKEPKRKE